MGYSNFVNSIPQRVRRPPDATADAPPTAPPLTKGVAEDAAKTVAPARAVALDAFRGLAIAVMLLVNNAALDSAVPKHMVHAAFGDTPTLADMVFPWFLLAVGIAIPFSVASALKKGATPAQQFWQIVRRVALLYGVGCLVDSSVRHEWYFGTGVLQLIALVSGAARLLYVPNRLLRLGVIAALLFGYGFALSSLPIAGFVPGAFTETHNLSQYLNDRYLHAYTLDGLLSVLPTTALALIGTLVGDDLRGRSKPVALRGRMLIAGAALTAAGLLWGYEIPMSKQFWTPPYICLTGGLGLLLLGVMYQIADVFGPRLPILRNLLTPLVIFGMNPLIAYAGAIFVKTLIFQRVTVPVDGKLVTLQESVMNALTASQGKIAGGWIYMGLYLLAVWLVCALLYKRRMFLRV